jgi:hypothetical protein
MAKPEMTGILERLGRRVINLAVALGIVGAGFYALAYTTAYGVNWWNYRQLSQIAIINDPNNAECLQKPFGVLVGYTNNTGRTLNHVTIRYLATEPNAPLENDVLQDGLLNFDVPVKAGETWSVCHSLFPREGAPTSGLKLYAQLQRAE